ncbi:hypothetical protein GCM10023225_31960 [Kineococcus glutinatus]|uniref:Deazaflavin-dependent oxidoreductase (Nitroreductase family) n=1 Tax=Kineococcus glutinatus TaxID=1070872 RepID=A0ABP8VB84_9ACTN
MRRPVRALVVAAAAGPTAVLAVVGVVVVGMRTRNQTVLTAVRRVNRAVTNPRQVRTAGQAGARDSLVRHTGRRSGRTYETPITAIPTPDGFVIGLAYGRRTDWLANVLAAGSATVVHDGHEHLVGHPQVVPLQDVADQLPDRQVRFTRFFGVEEYLVLRRVPARG